MALWMLDESFSSVCSYSPQSVCYLSKNLWKVYLSGKSLLCPVSSWCCNTSHSQKCWLNCPKWLSASKQEAGNWFQGITVKFCCFSLRLGGYTRTSGWPAEPAHHPSWSEHHSLPSASVSNPSISLQEHAGFKYIILDYNVSYFQNTLGVASFGNHFAVHSHHQQQLSQRSRVYSKHTDDYVTLSAIMWYSLCLTHSAPPVLPLPGQAWRIKEQETKAS